VADEVASSPRPVATTAEEDLVPGEPAATLQERVAPRGHDKGCHPEIQEAEEDLGAALSQDAASGGAQALELSCAPWAAAFEASEDADNDDEVVARNTLKRRLEWARHAFEELILPAASVSFLA
jgi:hypothetical protein